MLGLFSRREQAVERLRKEIAAVKTRGSQPKPVVVKPAVYTWNPRGA